MFTLLHTESSKGWGGQENRILQESLGLSAYGVRVIILCQPGSMLEEIARSKGLEVKAAPMRKSYDLPSIFRIIRLIREERVDIINTHSGRDSLLAGISGRLSAGKPYIVRTRHLSLPITSRFTYSVLPHHVVTVSESVRRYLIDTGVPEGKITAIPTGIDVGRFIPGKGDGGLREELALPPDVPVIGTIAIFRFKKGHRILLEAVPEILKVIPDAVFVFAGDGPQRGNIEGKIRELGLGEKVRLLGLRNDIPAVLEAVDVFVLPTLEEALGTSFLEAMAMQKPVIGCNVGGVGEVIHHGVNGYLIEPGDTGSLAEAVVRILRDGGLAKRMGEEGRRIVERNYTVERMCERMLALYQSLLGGGDSDR